MRKWLVRHIVVHDDKYADYSVHDDGSGYGGCDGW